MGATFNRGQICGSTYVCGPILFCGAGFSGDGSNVLPGGWTAGAVPGARGVLPFRAGSGGTTGAVISAGGSADRSAVAAFS